ncbi:MAG TPA: hypothetical protein VK478_00385 [Gemmatimonadaceae bacterium]|jgi:hypothetical protein|nr:hypothetical protein [Gemmatimonadaceae bacterium]
MRNFRRGIEALAVLAILGTTLSCGSSTSTGPVGQLSIKVVDQNNAGVFGVSGDLYKVVSGGGLLWRRSLTSADGTAVFGAADGGVGAGDYYIHVAFSSNHELAVGETNDRPVSVVAGDNTVITFHAVAKGPSPH